MLTKITFRNVVFVVLCVIFTLYAIDVIDINPKLIPLLLIVSIYLLSCKNWNIFSKENREAFSEDEKGTLVIPGNLQVKGALFVEDNVRMKKRVQIDGETKCQNIDTGNIVSNDITGKKITASNGIVTHGKLIVDDNVTMKKTVTINTLKGHNKTIKVEDNLKLTLSDETKLMEFGIAHNGRGNDKKQGLVIIDDAELRIHNRAGAHATHFNHKTNSNSDAGYYGNWIRLGVRYLHVHDGINTGTLNVRGDSTFNGHLTVENLKNIYHKGESRSIYGHGIAGKMTDDDGSICFKSDWNGRGLHIVGIKNGDHDNRVIRLHAHDTRFKKLTHFSGDGSIHRDDNAQFTIQADDHVKFILFNNQVMLLKYDNTNQWHFWNGIQSQRI